MQILVGSRRHDALQKARDWFAIPQNYRALAELVTWAVSQESRWGECLIFVEADVPASDRHRASNVDLLVAFSDRVALCEVKSYPNFKSAAKALFASLRQCCQNFDLVQRHLARCISDRSVRPFIFFPALDSTAIERLTSSQLSKTSLRHVTLTGGSGCQSSARLANGQPVYLPVAIQSRLDEVPDLDPSVFRGSAQCVLKDLIGSEGVVPFGTVAAVIDYLAVAADVPTEIRPEPGHVPGLRPDDLARARELLLNFKTVEVVGPPGIGKSSFVRELVGSMLAQQPRQTPVALVDLTQSQSLKELCHSLLLFFGRDPSDYHDEHAIVRRLVEIDGVVWVRSCAMQNRPLIKALLDVAATVPKRQCFFVLESVIPLLALDRQVLLGNLSWPALARIVQRVPSDHIHTDYSTAIDAAGNPRSAVARWLAPPNEDLQFQPELSDFRWLNHVFQGPERDVFLFVLSILADAPLGIRLEALIGVATAVFRGLLPSTVERAVRSVLDTLTRASVVRQDKLDTDCCAAVDVDTKPLHLVFLDEHNPSWPVRVMRTVDKDVLENWRARATVALEEQRHFGKHIELILGFRRYELVPYWRAIHSGDVWMSRMVSWLNTRVKDRQSLPDLEHYLERAIRILERGERLTSRPLEVGHYKEPPLDLDAQLAQLGPPPTDDPIQRHLWMLLTTVSTCLADGGIDGANCEMELRSIEDHPDVTAEALCWLLKLSKLTRPRSSYFELFTQLLRRRELFSPPVQMFLYYKAIMAGYVISKEFAIKERPQLRGGCCALLRVAQAQDSLPYIRGAVRLFHGGLLIHVTN